MALWNVKEDTARLEAEARIGWRPASAKNADLFRVGVFDDFHSAISCCNRNQAHR